MSCPWIARLAAAGIVAAGLGACTERTAPPPAPSRPDAVELSQASQKFLKVEPVGADAAGLGVILPGRVAFRPQGLSSVGTPLQGRVLTVHVRPGEAVVAGTPLVTLQSADVASARAALEQASAKAAAAEDLLKRQTEMVRRGVGLEVERFAAETAAREARAELARARHTTTLIGAGGGDRFVLHAPTAGVVMTVKAAVGAVAAPGGEGLVEIGDPRRLWIVAELPENEVSSAKTGSPAEVLVPAADARLEAVIDGVGQAVDPDKRRLPVYLAIKGQVPRLSPGMSAEVRLRRLASAGLSLPTTAVLIKDGSRRIVFVQRADGRFEPRPVRTGSSRDGRVDILEGLKPGERVVMRGALLLDSEADQLL